MPELRILLSRMRLLLLVVLSLVAAKADQDQFTPLLVSPLTASTQPFPGTDGKQHVVYELVLTNASPTRATLQKIEIVDDANASRVLRSFEGKELLSRLKTMVNTGAESPKIDFGETRLLLVDLVFDTGSSVPAALLHHVQLLGATGPGRRPETPAPLSYTVARLQLARAFPQLGPPLAGNHWVAMNGCCEPSGVHRAEGLSVNGRIYFAQRFAIDWMRLDDAGRFVHGDAADVHSYAAYGANVLAVADATVVSTLDTLDDQKPGALPDPKTITLENVDGNHVVLDLGRGLYAFYGHMQKGSITVKPGDHVLRGQVLGKLGNTGNSSAPHLHFHLMGSPSVLGSNGIPYGIDSFNLAGAIDAAKLATAPGIEGEWGQGLNATSSPRQNEFPMDLTIVDFPEGKSAIPGPVVWLNR